MKASEDYNMRKDYYELTASVGQYQLILGTLSLIPLTYLIITGGMCGYGIVEVAIVLVAWKIFSGVAGLVGSAYGSNSVNQASPMRHKQPQAGFDFLVVVVILMVIGVILSISSIFYLSFTARIACPGENTGWFSVLAFLTLYLIADVVLLVKAIKSAKRPANDEAAFESAWQPLVLDESSSKAPLPDHDRTNGIRTHFLQSSNWIHMIHPSDKKTQPLPSESKNVTIDLDCAANDEVEVFSVVEHEEAYFMHAEPPHACTAGYVKVDTA